MELREWLIILGLALVTLIVIDGVRRLRRQRNVPRLDQDSVDQEQGEQPRHSRKRRSPTSDEEPPTPDPEEAARNAQIDWELPNGGARVVKPATQTTSSPRPKLERQDPPKASGVFSDWQGSERSAAKTATQAASSASIRDTAAERRRAVETEARAREELRAREAAHSPVDPSRSEEAPEERQEPTLASFDTSDRSREDAADIPKERFSSEMPARESSLSEASSSVDTEKGRPASDPAPGISTQQDAVEEDVIEPGQASSLSGLAADPGDRDARDHEDEERYRLMDFDGMSDSFRSHSSRMGQSMQRFGSSLQKNLAQRKAQRRQEKQQREKDREERKARERSQRDQVSQAPRRSEATSQVEPPQEQSPAVEPPYGDTTRDSFIANPAVEKALRHHVDASHAQDTLRNAEEVVIISVLARDPQGFSGSALLELMLACGLRYSREMGIFNRFETEDPDSELQFSLANVVKPGTFPLDSMDEFTTPGVTLLMPLPGAVDSAAAFEAMFETAMVIVRHLGGELKDEQRSVMTAQTVEFTRQRVQDFERRYRLHRYQAN